MKVATFIFFSFKHGMIEMVIIMKKILIVEDDESIADSLKEMLENKAYIVEVSYSKKETLEKLNEYIDLILLDIQLPDGNGIDLCKEIKEKYRLIIWNRFYGSCIIWLFYYSYVSKFTCYENGLYLFFSSFTCLY